MLREAEYVDPNPPASQQEIDPATGKAKPVTTLYFKGRRHRRKISKNGRDMWPEITCSKGHDQFNPQPCAGCLGMESTGDKSLSLSDFFAFEIYHLAFYHGHPIVTDDGKILMKDNTTEPVLAYDECVGRDCNYCRIKKGQAPINQAGSRQFPHYDAASITTIFGRRRFLKMGKGHLEHLGGWDNMVRSACGTCNSKMETEGFSCPHCQTLLIDMENDTRHTKEIAEAVSKQQFCVSCKRSVFLTEATYCPTCSSANRDWIDNKLTDVVLFGCRQGEGTNSTLMLNKFQSLKSFQESNTAIVPFLNGKSLEEHIKDTCKPYDFNELFKPLSLQDQAKKLELNIPLVSGGGAMPGFTNYNNNVGPQSMNSGNKQNFSK